MNFTKEYTAALMTELVQLSMARLRDTSISNDNFCRILSQVAGMIGPDVTEQIRKLRRRDYIRRKKLEDPMYRRDAKHDPQAVEVDDLVQQIEEDRKEQ